MHRHGTFDEGALGADPVLGGHAEGFAAAPLVDASAGSLHQSVRVCRLEPGGRVDRHYHSYEEGVYLLSGTVSLTLAALEHELGQDGFAFAQAGTPHAWRNPGTEPATWLEVAAPQPKAAGDHFPDTFFEGDGQGVPEDAGRRAGRFDESQLPPLQLAGFTAANVSGASLKMLVDPPLGAAHLNLFTVQYAPGGLIKEHDHAFEEAYYFVEGEIEATAEGRTYALHAGDWFWTSVGAPHAFRNVGDAPVRWVETQVPQPPSREAARFRVDWPGNA